MSNYNWTEKQIDQAVNRLKDKKGWLGTNVFRVGNKKDDQGMKATAADLRRLMAILVERECAFDNRKNYESDDYKISSDWMNKHNLLAILHLPIDYFSPGLLSHPKMLDLPQADILVASYQFIESLLGRPLTKVDSEIWTEVYINWLVIRTALNNLQDTGVLKIGELPKGFCKKREKALLLKAHEIACMYKALEIGWPEIKAITPFFSHNGLFLELVADLSCFEFIIRCLYPQSDKPSADYRHYRNIHRSFLLLEQLTEDPDEYYKKLADKDPEISDPILMETHKKKVGAAYDLKQANEEFWDASRLVRQGVPQQLQDFISEQHFNMPGFYRSLLLGSSNSEVLKAAQTWEKASLTGMKLTTRTLRKEAKIKSNKDE